MTTPRTVIEQLTLVEAVAILKALAASDEQLANRIAELGLAYLDPVDTGAVAAGLYEDLEALEVEDVWNRSGKTRYGYVETSEAAYQMIEEVIDPYLKQIKKYQTLGLAAEACKLCMGLLLGLYQFERESQSKFKDWATDAPGEFAASVIAAWQAGKPRRKEVTTLKQFMAVQLNGWGAHLAK